MSTTTEIEAALKQLSLHDAQAIARWLQIYLDQQGTRKDALPTRAPISLPDYAARRRIIFGNKVLPNMVLVGRDEERW
ncbi:MAG: hypothetical protein EXS31_04395 [Pedosphaera sp.]|nr:hypothetical protein [Pedosphaera sp.]